MILQATILGSLGKDSEVREVNGQFALSYPIASTLTWKKEGQKMEKTYWTDCTQWFNKKESAENLSKYLRKGSKVVVVGIPFAGAYLNSEGKAVGTLNIKVDQMELVHSTKPKDQNPNEPPSNINNQSDQDDDDDLPF